MSSAEESQVNYKSYTIYICLKIYQTYRTIYSYKFVKLIPDNVFPNNHYGHGRVNALKVVQAALKQA